MIIISHMMNYKFCNFFFSVNHAMSFVISVLCYAWLLSHVWLFVTLWMVAHQAPLSMGILQARIVEWLAMPSSSRGSSQPSNQIGVSCIGGRFFNSRATWEVLYTFYLSLNSWMILIMGKQKIKLLVIHSVWQAQNSVLCFHNMETSKY